MEIELLNTKEELSFFPLNGRIILSSSSEIDENSFKNSISIFRLIDESGLFNFGDKYNQSIGYVREEFSTVPYEIIEEQKGTSFQYTLVPTILQPNSNYALFIDKGIKPESVKIEKKQSKSTSSIKAELVSPSLVIDTNPILKITSNPIIDEKTNIVKFNLSTNSEITSYTLNLKSSKNFVTVQGVKYTFNDTVYLLGEEFHLSVNSQSGTTSKNLIRLIKTSLNSQTEQITEGSNRVDYNSVLDYYKEKDNQKVQIEDLEPEIYTQKDGIHFKYLGFNKILIMFPETLPVDLVNLDDVLFEVSEAFDMYTLEQYGYYDPSKTYKLKLTDRSEYELLLEVSYD